MKGLKEFLEVLKDDKGLFAEVEKVQDDTAKIVKIAKDHGYSFTEDEYNDLKMEAVSGGGIGDALGQLVNWGTDKVSSYLTTSANRSEDADFEYIQGKTGRFAQSKKNGALYWQQNGGQWVEV